MIRQANTAAGESADAGVISKKLTFEEFLDWMDEDTWAEWVDGEVVVLSPATSGHQRLVDPMCKFFK